MNLHHISQKVSLLLTYLLLVNTVSGQQKNEYDYFIQNSDTVYSMSLSLHKKNTIYRLESFNSNGYKTIVDSIMQNNITTLSINNKTFDLITVSNKKHETTNYYLRKVDGLILLYFNDPFDDVPGSRGIYHYDSKWKFIDEYYVKFENGDILFVKNKKTIEKLLLPHLVLCDNFKRKYKGKFGMEELELLVKLYNNLCNKN